jgi:hypothetical protein
MSFGFHSLMGDESVVVALDCRHFPPPWVVEEQSAWDHSGKALGYFYFEEEPG